MSLSPSFCLPCRHGLRRPVWQAVGRHASVRSCHVVCPTRLGFLSTVRMSSRVSEILHHENTGCPQRNVRDYVILSGNIFEHTPVGISFSTYVPIFNLTPHHHKDKHFITFSSSESISSSGRCCPNVFAKSTPVFRQKCEAL